MPRCEFSSSAAFRLKRAQRGDRRRERRGLSVRREPKLVLGTLETQPRQRKSKRVVGFLKNAAGSGEFAGQFFSHSNPLRSLAGEQKSNFHLIRVLSRSGSVNFLIPSRRPFARLAPLPLSLSFHVPLPVVRTGDMGDGRCEDIGKPFWVEIIG